jgi:hypothetical protein
MVLPEHIENLRGSALDDRSIETTGCRSLERAEFEALSPLLAGADSVLEFPYPGIEPAFSRYRRFPATPDLKYWQPSESGTHLYILPEVARVLRDPNVELWITEAEKKSACLTQFGMPCIGLGGVWSGFNGSGDLHPEFDQVWFADRSVVVCFDSNAWRQDKIEIGHALYAMCKAVEIRGAKVFTVIVPPDDGNDWGPDDLIAKNGIDVFRELKRITLRHPALSQHKSWWENWIKGKTQESKEVARLAARLQPPEPWPEPVEGTALADEIESQLKRFITAPPEAHVVSCLWVLFAHAIDAFGIAPILTYWSSVWGCGKSVAQSIVSSMCPKPLESSSLSEAVTFRVVEKFLPTICVDEAQDLFSQRPELLTLFRASHMRRKAFVYRSEGDTNEPRDFSTWAPKCMAITTARIESALASRCLIIRMERQTKAEAKLVERFSANKDYPEFDIICRKASRWVQDNFTKIREADPQISGIENRDLDNFLPLFQIAEVIGGEWPKRIRDAALKLIGGDSPVDQAKSIELLIDIRSVFTEETELELDREGSKKIASADLARKLVAMDERPWSEFYQGKPISQNQLARLLKDFSIYSRQVRIGDKNPKGYTESQFKEAFERYLASNPPNPDLQPLQRYLSNEINNLGQKTQPLQTDNVAVVKSDLSIENYKLGSVVSVVNPVSGQSGSFPVELPAILDRFKNIVSIDTEFFAPPGSNPALHGIGGIDLRTGTLSYVPREELGNGRSLYNGSGDLVMAFAGTQDLAGLLQTGVELPANFIDVETLVKLSVNVPRLRKSPSLIESLDIFGIPHDLSVKDKKREQKRYAKPELTDEDRADIQTYCPQDARLAAELFLKRLPAVDIDQAVRFGEYTKENARIAFQGIPVDVPLFEKIQRSRKQIRLDLIRRSPAGEIYTDKGVRSMKNVEAWIDKNGFDNWQRTEKASRPCLQEDYLKKLIAALGDEFAEEAAVIRSLIDLITELKDFQSPPFGVAPDGRTHADQRPFGAGSGRNAPKKYILNARKWWRWLIRPVTGTAIASLDFASEEPAIAAYLSQDPAMIAAYEDGDVYKPIIDSLGISRKSAKACFLGIQYGRGSKSLAEKEGIPYSEAERILNFYRATYAQYRRWSDSVVETVRRDRVFTLPDGWSIRIDDNFKDSPEDLRTLKNFPVQGFGGVILREVVLTAAKDGIVIIGTHHDSILIEAPLDKIQEHADRLEWIMVDTSRRFLGGYPIRVQASIYTDRFEDEDGREDWERIAGILKNYE